MCSRVHPIAILLTFTPLLVTSRASAQADDLFQPYVSYSLAYDDNVFGLPGPELAEALTGSASTGDRFRSAQFGLQVEKTLGRQHVSLNLGVSDVEYDRYSQLGYQGRNLNGVWDWRVGNYLDGSASATYIHSLSPFDDYHAPARRLRTEKNKRVDIRKQFHPRWQIRGAAGRNDVSYDGDSQYLGGRKETSGELGMDYITPSGNVAGVFARRSNGAYATSLTAGAFAPASEYSQEEVRTRIDWKVTGKTRIQFSGGMVVRRHDTSSAKDFRGGNARMSVDWAVSNKVSLTGSVWRELGVVEDLLTAYSLNKGIGFNPQWAISEKLKTDIQLRYDSRDFRPSRGNIEASLYGDTLRSAIWSIHYAPGLHWLFQVSASRTEKDGRGPVFDFSRNAANFTVQYKF